MAYQVTLPRRAGVGLKPEHAEAILAAPPDLGFFEVHAENYMGEGGPPQALLRAIGERWPLSLHGVGLSLGAATRPDPTHLLRLARLIARCRPAQFSEHLAWSGHGGAWLNDLLPLPYTDATLARLCDHVAEVQDRLGLRLLIENPATYVRFAESTLEETDFLAGLVRHTGCGLLLDLNNVHVCATNHGFDARAWLARFPFEAVGEIHLAGHHADRDDDGAPLLIDAHDAPVADPVWALYRAVIARCGPLPTLIEWDNDLPAWEVLLAEATRAEAVLRDGGSRHAA